VPASLDYFLWTFIVIHFCTLSIVIHHVLCKKRKCWMFSCADAVDQPMSFMYILKNVMNSLSRLRTNARRYLLVLSQFFDFFSSLLYVSENNILWLTGKCVHAVPLQYLLASMFIGCFCDSWYLPLSLFAIISHVIMITCICAVLYVVLYDRQRPS